MQEIFFYPVSCSLSWVLLSRIFLFVWPNVFNRDNRDIISYHWVFVWFFIVLRKLRCFFPVYSLALLRQTIISYRPLWYFQMKPHMNKTDCLIRCHGEHCSSSQCCSRENYLEPDTCKSEKDAHTISRRYEKKEIIPVSSTINLEKFTVYKEEVPEQLEKETKLEISSRSQSCENTSSSNDQQQNGTTRNIGTDTSVCERSDNATDQTLATDDSNLGHDVVS